MVAGSFGGMSSSTCAIVSFVSIWAASLNVILFKKDHRHQFCSVPVQCNPCQLIPSVKKTKLRRSYFPVRAIRKSFPLLPLNSQYNADKDVVASVYHGWVRIVWPSSLPLPFLLSFLNRAQMSCLRSFGFQNDFLFMACPRPKDSMRLPKVDVDNDTGDAGQPVGIVQWWSRPVPVINTRNGIEASEHCLLAKWEHNK